MSIGENIFDIVAMIDVRIYLGHVYIYATSNVTTEINNDLKWG